MKIWIMIICLAGLISCKTNLSPEVHLKGQLVDMGSREVMLEYTGITGDFGSSRNVMIKTDAEGYFDIVLMIEQPCYFNISRNILYLSPGDELEVYLTPDTRQATYKGRGSEANLFLKDRLYPKGGSYLMSGRNIGRDFPETKKVVDSLAALKLRELEMLPSVSSEFKANERARILANQLNSYLMYPMYNRELRGMSREEARGWEENFETDITPEVNRLMLEIARNQYLDITDVRDVILSNIGNGAFMKGVEVTPEMKEMNEAIRMLARLDAAAEVQVVLEVEKKVEAFRNQRIADELRKKINGVKGLMTGHPAYDIIMTDTTGKEVRLSEFKGKAIYLDCWATWCGPCIQESPAFAALSKKYDGKDIVFIQISTDNSRKDWLNYLRQKQPAVLQYNSVDYEGLRVNWQIKYIPRFILIDKEFKIYKAFAPLPSDPAIEGTLNNLLKS